MEDPKIKIYSILKRITAEMGFQVSNFSVERPRDAAHGDFSSNIVMVLAKTLKKNPLAIAGSISKKIESSEFERIEAVAPGFINFYLSQKYLQSQVQNIIEKGKDYGSLTIGKGKKASVEFVSANPTGPLHIGNARGGPLGDAIANVLAKVGYKVTREYLHNDVGGQIHQLGATIGSKIGFYREFTFPKDKEERELAYQGTYIEELSNQVKSKLIELGGEGKFGFYSYDQQCELFGGIGAELMLIEILKDCEAMGIKFDKVRKESDLRKEVPQVLAKIKPALKEKDGAKWFAPADEFLKDRETVVQKSDGQFTYFASDIVYHDEKMAGNDLVIDVLGANHSGHVPRLKAVVKALGFNPDDLRVTLYQWVRLKRGEEIVKMSKRAGNFVTAKEVLDEVGKDAFRFFLLTPRSQTHMDFDLELAKKKASDNPVFYVQYAYSRICSIFKKAPALNSQVDLSLLTASEEIDLIRHLLRLPYLIEEAVKSLEVNPLTTYALEIATLFHKFYETQKVITQDPKLTAARLALLKATQITLKNTLDLLGVSAPDHM